MGNYTVESFNLHFVLNGLLSISQQTRSNLSNSKEEKELGGFKELDTFV